MDVHVLILHDSEELSLTFSSSSTVGDVIRKLGKRARNCDLVLFDGRPPRIVSETMLLAGLFNSVPPEMRKTLRLELKNRESLPGLKSYREAAVSVSKPSAVKSATPGLLRVPDRAKEEAQERKEQKQVLGSSRPRPSEGVLLSDLISMQMKESGKSNNEGGKPVKISLSSSVQQQKVAPAKSKMVRTNPNPADGRTDVKERGKERLVPKKKRPTKLKLIIQAEREAKNGVEAKTEEIKKEPEEKDEKKDEKNDEMKEAKIVGNDDDVKEDEDEDDEDEDDEEDDDGEEKKVVEEDGEKVNFLLIKKPFSNLDLKLRSETELEMNRRIAFFLKELKRFHQKLYDKNPEKAKLKKRMLLGLREVDRAARRGKLRCVFLAPNVEDIASKGGLNELQTSILGHCKGKNIPVLICMTRKTLGSAVGKRMSVSAVGVVEYDGANALWKEIAAMYEIVAREREARVEPPEEKKTEPKPNVAAVPSVAVDVVSVRKPLQFKPAVEFVPSIKK